MIWEDLKFFLTRLTYLSVSESMKLGDNGGFCVSTNCASENWIYYPERITGMKTVKEAVKFFADRNISFMWPVYDGGQEILTEAGLLYAGDLAAMSLEPANISPDTDNNITFEPVITPEQSREWAVTAWHSFGGGIDDTPENYFALVDAFRHDGENLSLYLARNDGKCAGTFLITHEAALMGVYYFAVVPEIRRKGIARAMMNEVCRLSGGKKIVLQATPSGRPFYRSFGFDELFMMPVYSTESDIF